MAKSDKIFNSDVPADGADFSKGQSFEVINYKAICRGEQICVCKKKRTVSRKVLLSKISDQSKFVPSPYGRALMKGPGQYKSTRSIAEIFSLEIPGDKVGFWKELYDEKEFCLWDKIGGGREYFKRSPTKKMYFWIFKVYELDIDLLRDHDYYYQIFDQYRVDKDALKRIQSSFNDGRARPVISDEELIDRIRRILDIVKKWDEKDDDDEQDGDEEEDEDDKDSR